MDEADSKPSTKICNTCSEPKKLSEFHRNKARRDGHTGQCKVCACRRATRWYNDNPDQAKRSRAAWYKNNRDHAKELMRQRRERIPEVCRAESRSWRGKNKEKKRLDDLAWQRANPDRMKLYRIASEARRRVAMKNGVTAAEIHAILVRQRFKCAICNRSVRKKRHVDHIKALSRGGVHHRRNLQILCPRCNVNKHAKDEVVFMRSLGFLI